MGYLRCDNGLNEQCQCDSYELSVPGVLHILSKNGAETYWLLRIEQMCNALIWRELGFTSDTIWDINIQVA